MESILNFIEGMIGTSPVEWIAVALGLANITLLIRRSIWNYPFGIIMVSLYVWVFFHARLYSDVILQVFFFFVQFYGWFVWASRRDETGKVIVRLMSKSLIGICVVVAIVMELLIGTLMDRFTDAAAPYWDASILVFSVIAQVLLANRYLENWIVWVLVDVLAIGLYASRGLEPTAMLYFLFLILATLGYFEWRRSYREGEAAS